MIRHKWSVGLRNKLSSLAKGARITNLERKELKELIYKVINYVDNKI